MDFKEKMPLWENEGVEPPKSKRESGWTAGDKPPADWFNWLHNRTYKSLLELRENSSKLKELIDEKADITDLEEVIKDMPSDFHDAPQNSVSEDMAPLEFEHGLTLCSHSNVNGFPAINDYGVSITLRGKNISYAQFFVTRHGDIWSRRSATIDEWNGEWYNAKKDIKKINDDIVKVQEDVDQKADKEDLSRASTIVIANYDSNEKSKSSADIVIEKGENAAKKINNAIQSLKGTGGEVKLMEGKYNLEYGIAVNVDNVHLTGIPSATILVQNTNWKENPYNDSKHIIDTASDDVNLNVTISNLYVKGAKVSGSRGFGCSGNSYITNCISKDSGGYGFRCTDNSKATNCTSINSSSDGFDCRNNSKIINCISRDSGGNGFDCWGNSQVTNCTSVGNKDGFSCYTDSQVTNCTSVDNNKDGFYCDDNSQITNCFSENSGDNGLNCRPFFKGVCSFNTLKGDKLSDRSSAPAVVEYNVIQEVQ